MQWLITKLLSAFVLPPLNFLILGIAGLALLNKRPEIGKNLLIAAIAFLWIFSLPVVGDNLARWIEKGSQLDLSQQPTAQAIVVLGGGSDSLERTRYAAVLQRRTGLPILVTGGDPQDTGSFEAQRMKRRLEEEFKVPVRWIESNSRDTIENARFSSTQLRQAGIDTILLVTNGWHMARAKMLFEQTGLKVVPAGTGLHYDTGLTILDFVPNARGMEDSRKFFHEVIGALWGQFIQHISNEI